MRTAVILTLLLIASAAVAGDLTIRQRTTSPGSTGATREETTYITRDTMVVDGDRDRTIIDLPARTVTLLDKGKKTYFTLDTAQLRAQAEAVQEELRKQLPNMPPDARAMVEKMMTPGGGATATPTGKREKIAGYDSAEYAIEAGAFAGTVWATESLPLPVDLDRWKEMSMSAMAPSGPGRSIAEAFTKVRGFPMRSTITGGEAPNRFSSTTEVTDVREESPPKGMLSVPDDYKKVDPPKMGSPMRSAE